MVIAFQTKSEVVHDKLRRDIVEGILKPAQRIILSDVAKEFGISEIPVREAIRRLETEGFVEFTPHVGAVVSKINRKEFIEFYLIRIELETLATKLATPHIRQADLDFLNAINKKMELYIAQGNHEKLGGLNKDFHLRIYKAGPYPYLYKMIFDLWEKVERAQSIFALVPQRAPASVNEHKEIVTALKNKKAALAAKLLKVHKQHTMKVLENYLKQSAEPLKTN